MEDFSIRFVCVLDVILRSAHTNPFFFFHHLRKSPKIMEVDDVETGQLLQRFSSMQTQDRNESIVQMRRLVGGELSEAKATFYLEMANWSVPAAVGYYFDLETSNDASAPRELLPSMTFVADITVGDGESVTPSTCFLKTWTIRNSGSEDWPVGCTLKLASGHDMGFRSQTIPPLNGGGTTNITIQMTSPVEPGIYESQWRLSTPSGVFFGDPIWSIVTVDPSGTLALTQQLSNLSANFQPSFSAVQARPTSPTDAQCPVVNSRSVLSRMAHGLDTSNQSAPDDMEQDQEMS